ncbi:uncharacterized protein LOC113228022 [Hyposmocoma kahamanoa]|uniref:uncharacterized protein LOC113228022 n=1 Tax=Hyposmocoma kahamanoa TaxID=1477025 RepID=UPI000E6DA1EE|nr:uncharacterized protein LOC113228022 [Hyposmocoma kahamanoa]
MSKSLKCNARAMMARSQSRSRSETPSLSRTCMMFGEATGGSYVESQVELEQKLWQPVLAQKTGTSADIFRAPYGSVGGLPQKNELQQSIHAVPIERAAAMDLDEKEGEAAAAEHRNFRYQLATSLVDRHLPQEISGTDFKVQRLDRGTLHVPGLTQGSKNRKYCHMCLRNGIKKKIYLYCITCDEALCPDECWTVWHTVLDLPGKNVYSRKGRRK